MAGQPSEIAAETSFLQMAIAKRAVESCRGSQQAGRSLYLRILFAGWILLPDQHWVVVYGQGPPISEIHILPCRMVKVLIASACKKLLQLLPITSKKFLDDRFRLFHLAFRQQRRRALEVPGAYMAFLEWQLPALLICLPP